MKKITKLLLGVLLLLPTIVKAEEYPSLYSIIKDNTSGNTHITAPSNFVGITELTEKDKKVYVYTGYDNNGNKNANNYAVIGNLCFRILRTTYTEGVKLTYYGKYKNNECNEKEIIEDQYNEENDKDIYVGYMYGDNHENATDSNIKTKLDNWYIDNLMDYSSWMDDAIYCNDRTSEPDYGYEDSDATRFKRYNNKSDASLSCPKNDAFTVKNEDGNKALTYPIGSISADEAIMTANSGNYSWLTKDSYNYYTLTPRHYTPVSSDGNYMYNSQVANDLNDELSTKWGGEILPVISVTNEILVKDGDGTQPNPYILIKRVPPPPTTTTTTTTSKEIITGSDEVENPPTGVYNYIWILPIIVLGGYIAYELIKNKKHFKAINK